MRAHLYRIGVRYEERLPPNKSVSGSLSIEMISFELKARHLEAKRVGQRNNLGGDHTALSKRKQPFSERTAIEMASHARHLVEAE
jgi:hypothetical protein